MAHKTLINGTSYEINGGKTLVNGTAYSIKNGKTLVGGTAYEVGFGPSSILNDNKPDVIQAVARAGQAANYWAVGDRIGITLNGTVGALTLSKKTYYAFIIGFNHNSSIEGNNTIHFQFGKTSGNIDIAFVDDNLSTKGSSAGFRINLSNTNSGGWKSSYMRSTICPAFKNIMPTEWKNIIASCTKYSDNTGGGSDTASYVTATSDEIFCLSEFEVMGSRKYANSSEQNYQKQYDYYKNGNSRKKYRHNGTSYSTYWWLRSVYAKNNFRVCYINWGGNVADGNEANYSYGFAPGFMVA